MSKSNSLEHTDVVFSVRFPNVDETLDQDKEWCWLTLGDERRRVRFHDYNEVYQVPGLYEKIFYEMLKCNSPEVVCRLLDGELKKAGFDARKLNVLDVGAGNGMVGERLKFMGVSELVGIDIIKEAKMAAERDRPDVYKDYFAEDLTDLNPETHQALETEPFNCLTTVAALGFGDIPPRAFTQAYNYIASPGWCAFNIKESFLSEGNDDTGFCKLIRKMSREGVLEILAQERYQHRIAIDGAPLHYIAIAAKKLKDIPKEWLPEFE
ncbi:MAG: methyltransferase [bacterium]|nr:methyltransferase [bacterium]